MRADLEFFYSIVQEKTHFLGFVQKYITFLGFMQKYYCPELLQHAFLYRAFFRGCAEI